MSSKLKNLHWASIKDFLRVLPKPNYLEVLAFIILPRHKSSRIIFLSTDLNPCEESKKSTSIDWLDWQFLGTLTKMLLSYSYRTSKCVTVSLGSIYTT